MSIEVTVKLNRDNAIFLSGESFVVMLSLRNIDENKSNSLAWGCVQLHLEQILLKPATRVNGKDVQMERNDFTSVVCSKQAIYSSRPAIIFCDISIKPSEIVKYNHTVEIPANLAPSFKGFYLKYAWYVTVAAQHVDAPIKMIQLPIRILNAAVDVDVPKPDISNPFLLQEWKREFPSIIEIALQKIEELTSIRSQRIYEIRSNDVVFATIRIYRNIFKLGDEFIAHISFSHKEISCIRFFVRLETVEINLLTDEKPENVCKHFSEHIWSAFINERHLKLPFPPTAVPSFSTEAIQLKWRIHFEFVVTTQKLLNDGEQIRRLNNDIEVESVFFQHYISVLPCNPFDVGLISNTPSYITFFV